MPTPVHEGIADYATRQIFTVMVMSGISVEEPGSEIRVCANREIQTGANRRTGRRIPDISIWVPLFPHMNKFFTGVVWEIGVAQSLASLKQRTSMWLSNERTQQNVKIHLVILLHVYLRGRRTKRVSQ